MPPTKTHTVWLTSVDDWREHAVVDADFEVGLLADQGVFPAVCGAVVPPCSMLEPPGPPCPACRDYHERRVAEHRAAWKHHNRWWRRLARRRVRRG